MQKAATQQQHLSMMSASLAVILVFAGFLWVDLSAFSDAKTESFKWYAALVGGILCSLSLLTGMIWGRPQFQTVSDPGQKPQAIKKTGTFVTGFRLCFTH